ALQGNVTTHAYLAAEPNALFPATCGSHSLLAWCARTDVLHAVENTYAAGGTAAMATAFSPVRDTVRDGDVEHGTPMLVADHFAIGTDVADLVNHVSISTPVCQSPAAGRHRTARPLNAYL